MKAKTESLKISIVIVNKNGDTFLEECLESVFNQGYSNLEVVMIDGGSNDNSLAIIESFAPMFHYFISEPDGGQYHAVQKGFEQCSGDIMAWINSDDKYLPGAFKTVAEVFTRFKEIEWLMGFPGEFDQNGVLLRRLNLPWSRWSKLRYYTFDFQFIQQESCFWRRGLWEKSGAKMDTQVKLAGDLGLWLRFFRHAKLYTTIASLAAFRQHTIQQRSRLFRDEYLNECHQLIKAEIEQFGFAKRAYLSALRYFGFALWPLHFYEIPILKKIYLNLYQIPPLLNYDMEKLEHRLSEEVIHLPPIYLGKTTITRAYLRTVFGWRKK